MTQSNDLENKISVIESSTVKAQAQAVFDLATSTTV